jgi:hypothetical protein
MLEPSLILFQLHLRTHTVAGRFHTSVLPWRSDAVSRLHDMLSMHIKQSEQGTNKSYGVFARSVMHLSLLWASGAFNMASVWKTLRATGEW